MRFYLLRIQACMRCIIVVISFFGAASVYGNELVDINRDFKWVDLYNCNKPAQKPPAPLSEIYEHYNFQRRYLRLGDDNQCQIMDAWIDRLDGDPSPGMRTLDARRCRFVNGKWVKTASIFQFFPYAIRRRDGAMFYVEATQDGDVGDNMAAMSLTPRILIRMSLPSLRAGDPPKMGYTSYVGDTGTVYQALAVILTQRLNETTSTPFAREVEKRRIRHLLKASWETLTPDKRVFVGPDGMPKLRFSEIQKP